MAVTHSVFREQGTVSVDPAKCLGCGQCARICPADVLFVEDGSLLVRQDSLLGCIGCGHCMMVCPEGAISVTGRGVSPDDLFDLAPKEARAGSDALQALMESRRSIRHFTGQEVDPDVLRRIVQMASSAPMGIPPWDVGCVIVCGREKVREVAASVVKGYAAFLRMFRPWILTLMRPLMKREAHEMFRTFIRPLAETYVRGWREGRDLVFHGAPALLLFHHSPYADPVDSVIPCTYAMLAAESLGLGTTMIGGAAPVLKRNRTLCAQLGIPEGNTPSIALAMGYPAVPFHKGIRRQFSAVHEV
ncbi:MAG: nitroreductase family protein [Armatimonadota bacterium]